MSHAIVSQSCQSISAGSCRCEVNRCCRQHYSVNGLGRYGGAEGASARELRCALLVEEVDFIDAEARGGHQIHDRTGEVTPAKQALLNRIQASLPDPNPLVRRQSMLEKVEGPAGLEDPPHLAQGGRDIGDGAQRPGGQSGVKAVDRRRATIGRPGRSAAPGQRVALRRFSASRQPRSAGSTAATRVTFDG